MQKILIVEDEKAISGVLQNILSEEVSDYEILVAEDGLEAFKIIEKEENNGHIKRVDEFLCTPDYEVTKDDTYEKVSKAAAKSLEAQYAEAKVAYEKNHKTTTKK